jgi:DNA-binding MarR family transcriptional regulator
MPDDSLPPAQVQGAPAALDAFELEAAVGFWLRLGQQQDLRRFNRALSSAGVTQISFSILLLIAGNPGRRQADLAAALRVRQPNLVEPIESLITRGLVFREPDPDDRRAQVLGLTPEGRLFVGRLRAVHGRLIDGYRAALGQDDYEQLIRLLRRFATDAPSP